MAHDVSSVCPVVSVARVILLSDLLPEFTDENFLLF